MPEPDTGWEICSSCDGTGRRDLLSGAICRRCGGAGWTDRGPDDPDPSPAWPDWARSALSEALAKVGAPDGR